jgi:hypothetical protein
VYILISTQRNDENSQRSIEAEVYWNLAEQVEGGEREKVPHAEGAGQER